MDNCIFQIETALLDFQEMAGAEDDKTSVIKRYVVARDITTVVDILWQAFLREEEAATDPPVRGG